MPREKTTKNVQVAAKRATRDMGERAKNRLAPYTPPWIAAGVLPPVAGFATHELWGDSAMSAGLACAGLGLSGVALTAVTWTVAGGSTKFRRVRRAQAVASVAAGMGWLTIATAMGPFTRPVLDLWLLGGGLFAGSWNLRQLLGVAPAGDDQEQSEASGWGKLAETIGLEKFQLSRVKGTDRGVVTAEIAVPASKTADDAQAAAPRLAAAAQVPPSGVTITKDPDNAGKAHLKVRVADMLKDGVPFTPPRAYGLPPTEPIPAGLYADAEPVRLDPFSQPILQHMLVMGVTGAGKSEFARTVLTHLMTRSQCSIILVDVAKGRQSVGHIADGIDYLVDNKRDAKRLLKALPRAIKARGDVLGDEGLDQWTPDSSLNALVVWMEEAADLADFNELDQIARAARSVGIWLVISLQRATWTNMSTDVRANLQGTACFGVDQASDAGFALPDRVVEAGAVPDWANRRPGYAYGVGMGLPESHWTTEWRAALTDRAELARIVAESAPFRDPLDEVTAAALGTAYEQRTHRGTNRTNTTAPAVQPAAPAAPPEPSMPDPRDTYDHQDVDVDLEPDEDPEADREALAEAWEETMSDLPPDPEPDAPYAHLRLEDDTPDPDPETPLDFGDQAERPDPEEARHILYSQIDGWLQQGQLEFEPADLIPAAVAAGRKRPWLQGQLKRMVEDGVLEKSGHGEYTILASPLQPA